MFAWMNSWHDESINEWEVFHGKGFIQIFFLDVLLDLLIADWLSIDVSGAEKHSWSMIVLIVNNVHSVVPEVLLLDFLLLHLSRVENNYLFTFFTTFEFLFLANR